MWFTAESLNPQFVKLFPLCENEKEKGIRTDSFDTTESDAIIVWSLWFLLLFISVREVVFEAQELL